MRCPKCGTEVSYLHHYQDATLFHAFDVDESGEARYKYKDTIGCEVMTYECPNCGVELANNEEDALAFLKGEISEEMATYFLELALEGGEK